MSFDFDDLDDSGEERAKIKALNASLLEAMATNDRWNLLERVRSGCTSLAQFEQDRDEKLGLGPIYAQHDVQSPWHSSFIEAHQAEDEEIAEQGKQLEKLLHFCPLGPLQIERGDFVEGGGGACSGALSAWLEGESCYEVRSASGSVARVQPGELSRLGDSERLLALQGQLVAVLSAQEGAASLEQCRNLCEDAVQYWKRSRGLVRHLTEQICSALAVDVAWYERMCEEHAETAEVKQLSEQIKDLTSFKRTLGPDAVEKGSLVELQGLKGEASKLNGTPAVVRDWDGDVRYIVSPLERIGDRKALKRVNIRAVPVTQFASSEEAKACLEALREACASSSAQDSMSKLQAAVPEVRSHAAALRSALLEVQRPLLQRFGFSTDTYGQAQLRRGLAEHALKDPALTEKFDELEAFGQCKLRFDGRVAIVTGGGRGLGRGYCKLLASRGAKVLVNNRTKAKADDVVAEITASGGTAVAEYSNMATSGEKVVAAALKHFGRIDIIIMNAGQLSDKRFEVMKLHEWTPLFDTHVFGHIKMLKAAWPHLVGQGYGRVIVTSSTSGVRGNGGQSNYGAAKMALVSLGQTIALEGHKHGILTNVICPVALTRLTNDVAPEPLRVSEEVLHTTPQPVAVPVSYLCHETCTATAGIYLMENGNVQVLRLQSNEAFVDYDLASGAAGLEAVSAQWPDIGGEWTSTGYPGQALHKACLFGQDLPAQPSVEAANAKKPRSAKDLRFDNRIAVVTNAGGGLGRALCLLLASRGARVYVCDAAREKADAVLTEIVASGGTAVADYSASGEKAVAAAVEEHDQVDILVLVDGKVPNAAFADMPYDQFQSAVSECTANHFHAVKAAWPQFYNQKYGRIAFVTSQDGLFGGVGKSQQGATSGSLIGMSRCLSIEGYSYGILVNAICVEGVESAAAKVQHAVPVAFLCHESSKCTAGLFRAQAGHVQALRWQSDHAFVNFDPESTSALEDVGLHWLDEPSWTEVSYLSS